MPKANPGPVVAFTPPPGVSDAKDAVRIQGTKSEAWVTQTISTSASPIVMMKRGARISAANVARAISPRMERRILVRDFHTRIEYRNI